MPSDHFETTLRSLVSEPLPPCPDQLDTEVWREISRRRKTTRWPLLLSIQDWPDLFAQPRLIIAGIAFALIIGGMPAVIFSGIKNTQQIVRQSIHFDVFSSNAPAGLGGPLLKPAAISPSL